MKRKLDQNGVPSPEPKAQPPRKTEKAEEETTFADLGLDPRLVQAVAEQSFLKPTLVQRKAIPLALNGQDVLCKAKTGSGKTAAYVLPVLAGVLKRKSVGRQRLRRRCLVQYANYCPGRCECCHFGSHFGSDPRTRGPGLQGHRETLRLLRQGYPSGQADGQALRCCTTVPAIDVARCCHLHACTGLV